MVHQLGAQSNEMTLLIFIICRNSMKCVSKRNVLMMLKVCDIFTAVTADKPRTMKLTIVRQRDKLEIVFKVVIHGFDDSDVHGNLQHCVRIRPNLYPMSFSISLEDSLNIWDKYSSNPQSMFICFSISCVRTGPLPVKVTSPTLISSVTCIR